MKFDGYKTENELRKEIADLEEVAHKGELTLPLARRLEDAKSELEAIRRAHDPYLKPWPLLRR